MDNDGNLGEKLLEQGGKDESGTPAMSKELARRVGQAKRTVWGLAALTVTLWGCVAAGAACYCWCFMTYIFPLLKWMATAGEESRHALSNAVWRELQLTGEITLVGTYVWAVLVVMAAVCTVLFILASRRATLRQIHGSLAEISRQLRALSERQ
jgi:hypothetical protein